MDSKKTKRSFINKTTLGIGGIVIVLLLAVALLWHGNANSMQAMPALVAQVYFDGEYRIADGPWQKMGTDVTEFKCSFGKAYLAPVYDFGSKEIVAWAVSEHPDLAQQEEMLAMLVAAKPEGAAPVLHSDMGWQYQHASYVAKLRENGFVQSMSRKGNCIDNGATEQVFGHIKDEFFRGRDWSDFESFKRDLEAYIHHWNHVRRQVRLKGLTPVEFREQALREAA